MSVKLKFLNSFLSELDSEGVWYVVLRNHDEILTGTEKDVDMLCSPSNFKLIRSIFNKVCSRNGHIGSWDVYGKNMALSTEPKSFGDVSNTFSKGLYLHFVGFASIRDSFLKVKIPGYSKKFRSSQIQRKKMVWDNFECWSPSSDWLILLLLEKMQYKRKQVYKEELLRLLNDSQTGIYLNDSLKSIINISLKENSTKKERLLAVQKTLQQINYQKNYLQGLKEWFLLIKLNLSSLIKKKGLIITFSGPDGAGKSTTKSLLIDFLQNDIGIPVNSIRGFNRLNEPKYMGTALKKVQYNVRGVNSKTADELENDFRDRKPNNGKGLSWRLRRLVGLLFIIIQYPVFYFFARVKTYKGISTVVDTSVYDRFVKAHRPRFRFLEKIAIPLLPSGDIIFRLYASPEVINNRKPELTIHELEEYYSAMDYIFSLKPKSNVRIIKTNLEPTIAAENVKKHVMYELGFCKI
jgi:hypothetical protein